MKITIFGLAGSGSSTIGRLLSEKTGFKFMSSGEIMRSWSENMGYCIYEFEDKIVKNDDSFDIKLDEKVKLFGEKNNNFIFESRLAWHFIGDSFKIYLKCDKKERYRRIQNREGSSLQYIMKKNKKRESDLVKRYSKIYPNIIFPPLEKYFDLVIDVTNISPEEIINAILTQIQKV